MTTDHDTGDECDADTAVPRMVAMLSDLFAKALRPYVGQRNTPETRERMRLALTPGRFWLAPYITIEGTIGLGEDHDPGDEDPRVKVRYVDGQWITV